MARRSRVDSPMEIFDENSDLKRDDIEKQKKFLEARQRARSPFFIGSIEKVNKKISKLDRKLQKYTQLVVESRASDVDDVDIEHISSDRGRDTYQKREKETREVNKFAGYFTMKQTFLPGRSERVKHISKVSMQPSKTTVAKKDSGKPKFVELHQYPGFDHTELSVLPDEILVEDMLKKAADAHVQLNVKPSYAPDFQLWYYSELSQAVFLDMFWYLFLEKYQSSKNSQVKLFNRTAHNFVKLLLFVRNPLHKDVFFKDYPSLLSQAIYAAYCHSFPDSYKQFGEQFKEDLVALVYQWIAGIKPAPRIWMSWNFDKLEPPNIKMREELANSQKKKKTASATLNFDFIDSMFSSNGSQYTSMTSLNQSVSKSSMQSYGGRNRKHGSVRKRNSVTGLTPRFRSQSPGSSQDGAIIDTVAEHQGVDNKRTGGKKQPDPRKIMDALTPIRETTLEEEHDKMDTKTSNASVVMAKAAAIKSSEDKFYKESHPACRGPDFRKSAFNIHGQSPLMAHFLRMKKISQEGGMVVRVCRTELQNLPALDAPTYKELIKDSFQRVREIEKEYDRFYDKNMRESLASTKKHREMNHEYQKLQSSLLARPKEVKRLCELLILEQNKDQDSVSAGADAALESALLACQD
ncbi:protein FAM227B-like [Ylistrum balloti]|uniref:protein FAM227B-like n=1 Tax=Ylistrum balloti TaxID=509963 RepID=UPI002905AE48|nr:protein FAM227B-like [Ylistrum balloti]